MTALRERIDAAIRGSSQRWYPGLATHLAGAMWRELVPRGLNRDSYGTTRMLAFDVEAPREIVARFTAGERPVAIEAFSALMTTRYGALRAGTKDIAPEVAVTRISAALQLLEAVPGLLSAVGELVRSLHLIGTDGPEFDTSYSDPEVPFSIFVGLHGDSSALDAMRLAESVVHETMHLQLSLIERHVPIVGGAEAQRYSPWQDRPRPAQGLLHGLYVFRAIQDFFRALPTERLSDSDERHRRSRITEIENQCRQLDGFDELEDLTEAGQAFAATLLRS